MPKYILRTATPDAPYGPTNRSSTVLSNDTDTIVGKVVSVTVIIMTLLVILVFMYRRKCSKEQLAMGAICRGDRYTFNMDNETPTCTGTLDIEQLEHVDNTNKRTNAFDQMHVISDVDQSNTSYHDESIKAPNEMYGNTCTATLEYKHLDSNAIDKGTKADDPLHITHAVDTDQTNYKSKTEISTEEHSNNEPSKETLVMDNKTVDSVYEPLDNDKKDKTPKAYDKLHVVHDVDTDSTNYYLNTMISSEKQSNYEPIDETDEMENKTAMTEY